MRTDDILDREGYNEPTILLSQRGHEMARAILALGRAGNISPAIIPPLLVHLFAVVSPDDEDRDHHRGALMFLAHEGGFTSMPSVVMQAGGEMRAEAHSSSGPPSWASDHRFIELVVEMQTRFRASIGVSDNGEETAIIVHASDEDLARDDYRQVVITWGPKVRATIAAIRGVDPGFVEIKLAKHWDPLKAMGIDAATPVPPADPIDKVILPTRDLRYGDVVKLWQPAMDDPTPMKPRGDEQFDVEGLTTGDSQFGCHETLGLTSRSDAGHYHRDFRGYRWEVVERRAPPKVASEAQRVMEAAAERAGF